MKTTTRATTKHGAGAAHVRWTMFGARGPLLAPEDDGSTGGGAGGDNTSDQTGAGGSSGGTPPQGDDRKFTQADVDRIVKERLARAEGGKKSPPASSSTSSSSNSSRTTDSSSPGQKAVSNVGVMEVLEMQDALSSLADERGVKPNAQQLRRMRQDYIANASNISDLNAWGTQWFDDMGLRTSDTSSTSSSTPGAETKTSPPQPGAPVTKPPMSDKGTAQGAPREFEAITDPNDLTEGDIERLVNKHGEEKANEMIAQLVQRALPKMRIKLGPERPE